MATTHVQLDAVQDLPEAVEMLLAAGGNIDARDRFAGTALMLAVRHDNLSMVELLLDRGADVNARDRRGGASALHMAVRRRNTECIALLFDYGADARALDFAKMTPLHIAIIGKHNELIPVILARPEIKGLQGVDDYSLLELALKTGNQDAARLLIAHGMDMDQTLPSGNTLLHKFVAVRELQAIRFLIDAGCDVEKPNAEGETALDLMQQQHLFNMVKRVEERDLSPAAGSP